MYMLRRLCYAFLLLGLASQVAQAAIDMDATYITRTPKYYRYAVDYPNNIPTENYQTVGKKRWPDLGETVTFTAHFINKGNVTCPAGWQYKWFINGVEIGAGTFDTTIAAGAEGTVSINWAWNVNGSDSDHTDQTVKFQIIPGTVFTDTYASNNTMTDYLEGVSLSIWVDTACYNQMNTLTNGAGTKSFEDWIRWEVGTANTNLGRSVYNPLAPRGCLERLRIDKIVVATNAGQAQQSDPDFLMTDGRWQFTWGTAQDGINYANQMYNKTDWGLVHEIMHQIGIIDLYRLNFGLESCQVVAPDGSFASMGWSYPHAGLMGGGDITPWTGEGYLEQHTVLGMNKNVGYRRGYYGEYLHDVPLTNTLRVLDAAGNPAAGVTVRIFQTNGDLMDNFPDISGTTAADGTFVLPNRSVSGGITTPTGHTLRDNPFGIIHVVGINGRFLVEFSKPGQYDYRWMDITDFNQAYWSGDTAAHTFTFQSRIGVPGSLTPPTGVKALCEGSKVTVTWDPTPGAASYSVYRAGAENNYLLAKTTDTAATSAVYTGLSRSGRYTVSVKDSSGRESGVYGRAFAPILINPYSVGIRSDNVRIVLDPQNGYALSRQASNGRYIENFGIVHFHLERSYDVVVDTTLNRLVFAHAGDDYSTNQSVRINDMNASLEHGLAEYGTTGSGDLQFQNPSGVAVDNSSRIYVADKGNHRIQVLSANGAFITKFGTAGTGNSNFASPQNVSVTPAGDKIFVADRSNKRIQILSFNGSTISYLSTVNYTFLDPTDVALAPDGRFFVVDASYSASSIYAFDANGNYLQTYTVPTDGYTGRIKAPMGAVVDKLGNLVVADTGNKRVVTFAVTPLLDAKSARFAADGTVFRMEDKVVTAKFTGFFYVEDADRTGGMRITSTTSVAVGDKVSVYGAVQTINGERHIVPFNVVKSSTGNAAPNPLGMNLKTMGGGPLAAAPGITNASGLNNVGLLIKVYGKSSDRNTTKSEFNIVDGYGAKIKVYAPGLTIPADNAKVVVTGISGADNTSGSNLRVLRAKSIQVLP